MEGVPKPGFLDYDMKMQYLSIFFPMYLTTYETAKSQNAMIN